MKTAALVIGASSTIAQALIQELLHSSEVEHVVAVSRQTTDLEDQQLLQLTCDYTESSIQTSIFELKQQGYDWRYVFMFNGVLHNEDVFPEKRLEDIKLDSLQSVFMSNAMIPMLWIKHLIPLVKQSQSTCCITALSARVGSISDNHLGGWYAYRASKAALNMLLKTSAIEYGRRCKNTAFVAFHPGTTDTSLSKPFQANVPTEKLFTPEFVAQRLLKVVMPLAASSDAYYLDFNGQLIKW